VSVKGEVVGINSAIASETGYYSGYGFAIPMNLAKTVMNQLVATGKVQRAALGIEVNDARENDAAYVGLKEIRGVVVNGFPDGIKSPAQRAGLEPGDVIVAVDGHPVDYVAQLQQVVGFRKPGDAVKVEVARKGGVHKTFTVELMAQDDSTRVASDEQPEAPKPAPSGAVSYDELGISAQNISPSVAQEHDLDRQVRGVLVTEVDPNGPAYGTLASPEEGGPDIIQAVEGSPIRSEADLRTALRSAGKGAIVTLRVYNTRAGQTRIERIRLK
jgi:serine protease Do